MIFKFLSSIVMVDMFTSEQTLHRFMMEKAEGQFHDSYERALEQVRSEFGKNYTMLIGGVKVRTRATAAHTSPIDTRIVLGHMPIGGISHVKQAIAAAKKAFEHWGKTDYRKRVQICRAAAEIVAHRKFELAAWVSYENGKNRYEALADVDEAIDFLRYYSEEMERNNGFETMMKGAQPTEKCKSTMKPYGVWGVIAPFNFPIAILVGMSAGAIVTGNTVVAKPSSNTPIIACKFAEIFKQAGLPDGVFNLIIGPGTKVGSELVSNKDVAGIVFTGSREIGFSMAKEFSKTKPKSLIAELGGKNPVIVTETADLNNAVEGVLKATFGYSGQKCSACSRVYVHKKVRDEFLRRLVKKTRNLPIGNPLDPNTFVGPLANEDTYRKYQKYIKAATKDGKILVGGSIKMDDELKYGYYAEPTIITGLPNKHRLFREEMFVPILCVADYENFDDAIKLANDTEYGLTAGIFTNKHEEIKGFLDSIEAGVIYINRQTSATTGAMVGCQPFGGWKDSGTTGRGAGGPHYLIQFMREQSQTIVE